MRQTKQSKFVAISYVNNEAQIFDIMNLTALVINIFQIKTVEKDRRVILYKKLPLKMIQTISQLLFLVAQ